MRKLRLDVARLEVESFPTAPETLAGPGGFAATPLCVRTLPVNDCLTHDTFQNC